MLLSLRLLVALVFACLLAVRGWTDEPGTPASPSLRLQRFAQPGKARRVEIVVEASGKLRLNAEGRGVEEAPMSVRGRLVYRSQIVATDPALALRHYDVAEGRIHIRKWESRTRLQDSRRWIVVERPAQGPLVPFSPEGPLTSEDLDVIGLPLDPLALDGLLPSDPVAPDRSWKVPALATAALFAFDVPLKSTIRGRIEKVESDIVRLVFDGEAEGTVDGATTRIDFLARVRYRRKDAMIDWVAARVHERRAISHAAPGFDTTARIRIRLEPIQEASWRPDSTMIGEAKRGATAPRRLLLLRSRHGYELLYPREWKLVIDGTSGTILRLIRSGDLIAQINIAVPDTTTPLDLAAFQGAVRDALDDRFEQWLARETLQQRPRTIYRVVAAGTSNNIAMQWIYYYIREPGGRHAIAAIAVEGALVDRFAAADEQLIRSFAFTETRSQEQERSRPPKTASPSAIKAPVR